MTKDAHSFIKKSILHTNSYHVPETEKFWFSLDNAAKIFPAIINKEVTSVFRLSAVLNRPIQIEPLRKAVLRAENRFPYYKVQLRKGFFWYYLEHMPRHIPVEVDDQPCCRMFRTGHLLIRILVWNNRLSIECSHILADGGGAFEFLKTLLILYSKACGKTIPPEHDVKQEDIQISEEEYEDAYKRYFREDVPPMVKRSKAFHLPYPLKPSPRFQRLTAILPMKQLRSVASGKEVSITVYLTSVYLYVLQELYESQGALNKLRSNKILRVQVPINLRNIFPSRTMRNFSLFVMPEIDLRLGHYTFEEIIKTVYHQVQLETDKKLINKNISRNVGSERKIYVRSIPLFLKSWILRMKYYALGTSQYSGVVTNVGRIHLPPETEGMVSHFIVVPPPPNKMLKVNCGIVGFKDKVVMSFGNVTISDDFESRFLRFLRDQDISVEIEKS